MVRTVTKRTAFGVDILNSSHQEVKSLKLEGHVPEIHGNKFWNSSFLIMQHLKKNPLKKGTRVLEIGCGWGLLGIFCAKEFGAKVTGVDADRNVFPYMQLHARINGVRVTTEQSSFENLRKARLADFDLILGSDICFWDEMTGILFNLIKRSKQAGVKQIIISDPCRTPFTALADRCQEQWQGTRVLSRRMTRPVRASGQLLVIGDSQS